MANNLFTFLPVNSGVMPYIAFAVCDLQNYQLKRHNQSSYNLLFVFYPVNVSTSSKGNITTFLLVLFSQCFHKLKGQHMFDYCISVSYLLVGIHF